MFRDEIDKFSSCSFFLYFKHTVNLIGMVIIALLSVFFISSICYYLHMYEEEKIVSVYCVHI